MGAVGILALVFVAGCAETAQPPARASSSMSVSRGVPATSHAGEVPAGTPNCTHITVALDPGHNPIRIDSFDPVTGAAQIDYPNGAEGADVFTVATEVRDRLQTHGYHVVLLKRSLTESVTYRQRVDRAIAAHASIGISIHTSPGANAVFVQRVGLYREGIGANGSTMRVTFHDPATAAASQRYGAAIAAARTRAEDMPVHVTDNDFSGRAPLWTGNIPIIALISDSVPWVYNEFGLDDAGGSIALPPAWLSRYAEGIADGVQDALPVDEHGCGIARDH